MKNKILKKILIIVLLTLMLISRVYLISNAAGTSYNDINLGFVIDDASDSTTTSSTAIKIIGSIITVLQVAASGCAVIMLIVIAIKYMAASAGEKADIKKSAITYVVGAIILFAATGILGIIRLFAENVNGTSD